MHLMLAAPPSLFLSHGKREGWGISLYGPGNNGSASIQWSWSLKDARDRLGHKWRAGIFYYLLERHIVHKLRVEVLEKSQHLVFSFSLSLPVALSEPGLYVPLFNISTPDCLLLST